MSYVRSFLSNIILFYLFNDRDNLSAPHTNISKFNMYDNIEDYFFWAERRLQVLLYECSDNDWKMARKVRYVDQNLIRIFPFLSRVVDRSYVIERFLTTLELFVITEENEDTETPAASPEAPVTPTSTPVLNDAPLISPVAEISATPTTPALEVPTTPATVATPVAEAPAGPSTSTVEAPSPETPILPVIPISEIPISENPSISALSTPDSEALAIPLKRRARPKNNDSVYKLRRVAHEKGIKHAFLLSKVELQKLLKGCDD